MDFLITEDLKYEKKIKVVAIHVNNGQLVSKGDFVIDVEVEKATITLEVEESGVFDEFHVQVGDFVKVGQKIAEIRELRPDETPTPKKLTLEEEVVFLREENARLQQELDSLKVV